MSKTACIFPGQGSQYIGMGKALAEVFPESREIFERADEALGEKLSVLCWGGPEEELKRTANQQPAILTTSIAAWVAFAKRSAVVPAFFAGHSLGEYSALAASTALSFEDAVRAVRARGQMMQEAVPEGRGAMAVVLGLGVGDIQRICVEAAQGQILSPANYNEPNQTVIAGDVAAVERAGELLKAAGARRVLRLPVSAPFHCPLMLPVKARFATVLEKIHFTTPSAPIVSNTEAVPNADASRIGALLLEQVAAPVRWVETVEFLFREGVSQVIEFGPGKVLSGLVKKICPQMGCANIEDEKGLNALLGGAL
ncbi:MAG: ACP S-malonyltransferase [Proteobacteria bacterium]|nr:ACP S-malonyltransferase [Cystobacterineae bacterium]MCL2258308.1 ACP S-malonyltransferase [Cystobacterineae bacterium]MCL2315082.1 ACP S-malonyltransferase [Pseudomonadota bacterium]